MSLYAKVRCWLWVQFGAMFTASVAYPIAVLLKVDNTPPPYVSTGILILNLLMVALAVLALVKRHLLIAESRKNIPREEG